MGRRGEGSWAKMVFTDRLLPIKTKMAAFRGQDNWVKMTASRSKFSLSKWKDYLVANVSKNDRILGEGQLAIIT
jgi:hypothetical protein